MPNQLSQEQLSQKIITIEIAKRPLQSSQLKVNLLKSASQWMNELLGKIFPLHYAIIVKTEEKGQYILHNLQEGFTCSTITDEEKHHYQQYEIYQQDQFNKIFTVQDIYDQSSQHKKYNLISNSCIHYVNFVKKYINEFLKDINNQATDRVQIQSLLQTAKILIKSSFQNIVNNSIDMSLINKLAQVNLKDPSFYFDIISEIIRCSKQQSIWEIFGNAVIITIISIINLIPLVNGVIAAGAILVELYFIWNQSDESIFTRSIKSLYVMGQFALGVTIGQVSLHDLFDMCYELIQKIEIIKWSKKQKIFVGGCTIMGMIFGGFIQVGVLSLPSLGFIPQISTCTISVAKAAILIVANIFSGGNSVILSFLSYLAQTFSFFLYKVAAKVSFGILTKIGLSFISIGFSQVVICGVVSLVAALAIIKIFSKIEKQNN